jgi:hypothetical protein
MYPPLYQEIQTLFLITTVVFYVLSFANTKYLPSAYLLTIIFRPGEINPFFAAIRFELIAVAYIIIMIFVKNRINRINFSYHPLSRITLVFFIVCSISIVQAYSISYSYDYAYRELYPNIILFITIICFSDSIKDVKIIAYTYIATVVYLAWLPIFNFLQGVGHLRIGAGIKHAQGETSGVGGHVALANLMTQSIPFAYYLVVYEKKILQKILCLIAVFILIIATIGSGSRGGFIGLMICAVIITFKSERKIMSVLVMVPCIFFASSYTSTNYLEWISSIFNIGSLDYSADSRTRGLLHGIEMAVKRPLLGVGLGCYGIARRDWFGWGIWAHNLYGELIGELGLAGIITWGKFIYESFVQHKMISDRLSDIKDSPAFLKAIMDAIWTILLLRLLVGYFTHSLMAYIWYMLAAMIIVLSKDTESLANPRIRNK